MVKKSVPTLVAEIKAHPGSDPERITQRLYNQVSRLLQQLEGKDDELITLKERVAALIAIGRLAQMFQALRKREPDDEHRGTKAKQYQSAFAAPDGTRRRSQSSGPAGFDADDDDWFEPDDGTQHPQ